MSKPAATPKPSPATLATQKSDFTAEGSPPPGLVLTSTPVKPRNEPHSVPADAAAPQRRKRKARRVAAGTPP